MKCHPQVVTSGYVLLSWDDGLGICRLLGGGDWLEEILIPEGWTLRFIGYLVFLSGPGLSSHCPETWGGEVATYSHHRGAVSHSAVPTMMDGIPSNCVREQILPPLSWSCKVFYGNQKSKHYSCISSNGWVAIQSVHPILCPPRHCVGAFVPLLPCQHWFSANTSACALSSCGLTCVCLAGSGIPHLFLDLPARCVGYFMLLW